MKILAIDSSSKSASAAISEDEKILGEVFLNVGLTHSETLMPMLEYLLKSTGVKPDEIERFALTIGPGSFTGIRIGAAAVKGMAQPQGKKCIPVSTLEAIAFAYRDFDGIVCPVMDARCNQVYTAVFESGVRIFEDSAMLINELSEKLKEYNKKVVFVGDGAELVFNRVNGILDCERANSEKEFPHASSVALLALKNSDKALDAGQIVPVYLRLPQAQRELNNKTKVDEK